MDRAALDAAYNNSAAVADSAATVEDWTRRTAALRSRYSKTIDLRYGDAERNRFGLFRPAELLFPNSSLVLLVGCHIDVVPTHATFGGESLSDFVCTLLSRCFQGLTGRS